MATEKSTTGEAKKPARRAAKKGAEGDVAPSKTPSKSAAKGKAQAKDAGSAQAEAAAAGGAAGQPGAAVPQAAPPRVPAVPAATQSQPETRPAAAASHEASGPDAALLPAQRGKIGIFGGPKDRGIKPDDKLALPTGKHFTYERVRSLDPRGFYCAMRWDYRALGKTLEEGKRFWANKRLLITNLASGLAIVARAVDYGPHENSGLDIAVSPGAAEALGVNVGDDVEVNLADPGSPLGLVKRS